MSSKRVSKNTTLSKTIPSVNPVVKTISNKIFSNLQPIEEFDEEKLEDSITGLTRELMNQVVRIITNNENVPNINVYAKISHPVNTYMLELEELNIRIDFNGMQNFVVNRINEFISLTHKGGKRRSRKSKRRTRTRTRRSRTRRSRK